MRVLVAIANYGFKNRVYLDRVISEYRSMSYDVDIVVFSNVTKDLGDDVEVIVGLPTRNPWSLPFGHKKIFAERLEAYDLFIYSEDDILLTQRNVDAFLHVTRILPTNKIAGFLRYETNAEGDLDSERFPDIHWIYHWDPNSVESFGEYTFAFFTNEHAACYLLTREHLREAIASGGFLVPPHEGRYDLLCSAATDPYTQCGFTKVIGISHIQDFLVHHLSDAYRKKIGIDRDELQLQIDTLHRIKETGEPQSFAIPTRSKLNTSRWDKNYYSKGDNGVLSLVPDNAADVLSVGCGWGIPEKKLIEKSIRVVGIPLDAVIAESARSRGIEVLAPDLALARETLGNTRFDCILLFDILQHVPHPAEVLAAFDPLLKEAGCIVVTVPNFAHVRRLWERSTKKHLYGSARTYDQAQVHFTTPSMVSGWVSQSNLKIARKEYRISPRLRRLASLSLGFLDRYLASEIVLVLTRS